MEKINFANNSEPYLSAENLNQMQENIEEAIQKDITTDGDPVKIGYAIDGKDVYVKRIKLGNLPNAGQIEYPTGLIFGDITIVDDKINAINESTGGYFDLPYIVSDSYIYKQFISANNTIRIITNTDRSSLIGYANIYFTYNE